MWNVLGSIDSADHVRGAVDVAPTSDSVLKVVTCKKGDLDDAKRRLHDVDTALHRFTIIADYAQQHGSMNFTPGQIKSLRESISLLERELAFLRELYGA